MEVGEKHIEEVEIQQPPGLGNDDNIDLLGQWLNLKLFGIIYLVGNIKSKPLFQGSIR